MGDDNLQIASDDADDDLWTKRKVAEAFKQQRDYKSGKSKKAGQLRWMDLSYWQFRNGDKGFDFSGMDLTGVSLVRADLRRANFTGANLRLADLEGANLEEAILYQADLSGARMRDAVLHSANMEAAHFKPMVVDDNVDADVLEKRAKGEHKSNLSGIQATNARMVDAVLTGCDLSGACLTGVDLTGAELTGADLSGAKVEGVKGVDPTEIKRLTTQGTKIDLPKLLQKHVRWLRGDQGGERLDVRGQDFSTLSFAGQELTQASLRDCRFDDADFTGAILINADLSDSSFIHTDFTGADLSGAKLQRCFFREATLDEVRMAPTAVGEHQVPTLLTKSSMVHTTFRDAKLVQLKLQGSELCAATLSSLHHAGVPSIVLKTLKVMAA